MKRIMGLVALSFVLYLFCSLLTFDPRDTTLWSYDSLAHRTQGTLNAFGPAGANTSEFLFQIFGFNAFISAFLLLHLVLRLQFQKKQYWNLPFVFVSYLQWMLCIGALCSSYEIIVLNRLDSFLPGGRLGQFLHFSIRVVFGEGGAVALCLVAMLVCVPIVLNCNLEMPTKLFDSIRVPNWRLFFKPIFGLWQRWMHRIEGSKWEKGTVELKESKLDQLKVADTSSVLESENIGSVPMNPSVPKKLALDPTHPKTQSTWKSALDQIKKSPEEPEGKMRGQSQLAAEALSIEKKLETFGVGGKVVSSSIGPVLNTHFFEPAQGVKVTKILALQDDLALALKAQTITMTLQPGQSAIGIELPSANRCAINFKSMYESALSHEISRPLPLVLGANKDGSPLLADLSSMPHLLVAGSTGSGKSVGINTMLLSLILNRTPKELRLILVDPKMLELSCYETLGHLLMPVVTDPSKAAGALRWALSEMDRRYALLKKAGVRSIQVYNETVANKNASSVRETEDVEHLPYIVIVIDELCDLMMTAPKDVEECVQRLAQKARAAGIHLILATQRPSVDVLTGVIKANLPCRISYQVASRHDSRTIIESIGAERLLGKGDFLFVPPGSSRLVRGHGAFVSDGEVAAVIEKISLAFPFQVDNSLLEKVEEASKSLGKSDSVPTSDSVIDPEDEEYFERALEIARSNGSLSTSSIQRHFRIGYNKAARIMDLLVTRGIIEKQGLAGKPRGLANQ